MFVVTNPIEHVRAFDYDGISGVTHVPGASEAGASFGNATVYMEKFVERPRHIEIQVMGDRQGNVIHFGERECSIQRRHQKVIEECPSPVVSPELRARMGEVAVKAAKAVNYHNAVHSQTGSGNGLIHPSSLCHSLDCTYANIYITCIHR